MVIGGPAAVAATVLPSAERVAGADRYATAATLADWAIGHGQYPVSDIVLTQGESFADALVAGTLRRPLLLAGRFTVTSSTATAAWLGAHVGAVTSATLVGGRTALSSMSQIEVEDLLNG